MGRRRTVAGAHEDLRPFQQVANHPRTRDDRIPGRRPFLHVSRAVSLVAPVIPRTASDDARIASLVTHHLDAVWASLRRLGVPEASADDAAQEVFLVASKKMDAIQPGRERAFLLGIALRVASASRRALRRRREVSMEEVTDGPASESPEQTTPGPDSTLEHKRDLARLASALSELPDDVQAAFVLFELEELSAPEVAEVLDIPVGTVASRVRRARAHVRQRLLEEGGSP
jgi:RNA polymerase sigma-70 factor, ECF subfamily